VKHECVGTLATLSAAVQASVEIVDSGSVHQLCQIKSAVPRSRSGQDWTYNYNGRSGSFWVRGDRINRRESKMLRQWWLVTRLTFQELRSRCQELLGWVKWLLVDIVASEFVCSRVMIFYRSKQSLLHQTHRRPGRCLTPTAAVTAILKNSAGDREEIKVWIRNQRYYQLKYC
jgi:hypothetical protein